MLKVLLATDNPGKIREMSSLLEGNDWQITTPGDENINVNVEESGETFEENAAIKARAYLASSGLITVADDSGLEVEALNGEPGVRSARYAGDNASDADRVEYLLTKLAGVPLEERKARFRCVIAIAFPEGNIEFCEGECPGVIAMEPRGENGFGYDPIFFLPELGKMMAELDEQDKNKISHRGKAARKAHDFLKGVLDKQ